MIPPKAQSPIQKKGERRLTFFFGGTKKGLMKFAIALASVFGLLSVVLGALGAHALKKILDAAQLASWETGVRYQLAHALALLAVGLLLERGMNLKPTLVLFTVGTVLFSGSIYLLCLKVGPGVILGPLTPIGGLLLTAGWGWMLYAALSFSS